MGETEEYTNIFVKNLDSDINDSDIERYFSPFGDIISHRIIKDRSTESKVYAYIEYAKPEDAVQAVQEMNGYFMYGNELSVEKYIPKEKRLQKTKEDYRNVYVKNFGEHYNDAKLKNLFKTFGNIVSCKVQTDESNKSKGFGFVCFSDHSSAVQAVKEMNGKQLRNKNVLYVAPHKNKAQRQNEINQSRQENLSQRNKYNLYVKNLDASVDNQRLFKLFSRFGNITSAKVIMENGISKKFGFVCFDDHESAKTALEQMNGRIIASKALYVNWFENKEERAAHLRAERMQTAISKLPKNQIKPLTYSSTSKLPYGAPLVRPKKDSSSEGKIQQVHIAKTKVASTCVSSPFVYSFGIPTQSALTNNQALPGHVRSSNGHVRSSNVAFPRTASIFSTGIPLMKL